MEKYLVVIGKTSTGYGAHCPDVLGCATTGKTPEKCLSNMKKALEFHFEGMAEDGDAIPKSGGAKTYSSFIAEEDSEKYLTGYVQIDISKFQSMPNPSAKANAHVRKNGHLAVANASKTKKPTAKPVAPSRVGRN